MENKSVYEIRTSEPRHEVTHFIHIPNVARSEGRSEEAIPARIIKAVLKVSVPGRSDLSRIASERSAEEVLALTNVVMTCGIESWETWYNARGL